MASSKMTEAKQSFKAAKAKEIAERTAEMVAAAKKNSALVLNAFRIEKHGNDAHVYERVILTNRYAGMNGVKEFVSPNGKVTYYTEKLVKKYSDNVVKS